MLTKSLLGNWSIAFLRESRYNVEKRNSYKRQITFVGFGFFTNVLQIWYWEWEYWGLKTLLSPKPGLIGKGFLNLCLLLKNWEINSLDAILHCCSFSVILLKTQLYMCCIFFLSLLNNYAQCLISKKIDHWCYAR